MIKPEQYVRRIVESLARIPRRGATLRGEREAAKLVADELDALGYEVSEHEFRAPARFGSLAIGVFALGLVGLLLGFEYPLIGLLIGGAALLLVLKLNDYRSDLLTRLLSSGSSRNVVGAREVENPTINLVLSAHIDAAQSGLMFHPRVKRLFAKLNAQNSRPHGPLYIPTIMLGAGLAMVLMRLFNASGWLPDAIQGAAAAACGLTMLVCVQWSLSPYVPGAIDNASGVAAMLLAARELGSAMPKNCNVYVAATGAEEAGLLGMRAFMRQQREMIAARPTYFINLESVGGGELRAVTSEGLLGTLYYRSELNGLARHVARREGYGELELVSLMAGTDSAVPVQHGHQALCLIALDEQGMPPNYHEMADTPDGVDYALVAKTANLGCAVCRELDAQG